MRKKNYLVRLNCLLEIEEYNFFWTISDDKKVISWILSNSEFKLFQYSKNNTWFGLVRVSEITKS